VRDEKNKEMDEILNNRYYIYSIPENILFDADLTINELRIYFIVSSYDFIKRDFVKELKGRLENYYSEYSIDESIEILLAKDYLVEEGGYLSIYNKESVNRSIDDRAINLK
jgi:uncharacterized membrane protein YukC